MTTQPSIPVPQTFSWEGNRNHARCVAILQSAAFQQQQRREWLERLAAAAVDNRE